MRVSCIRTHEQLPGSPAEQMMTDDITPPSSPAPSSSPNSPKSSSTTPTQSPQKFDEFAYSSPPPHCKVPLAVPAHRPSSHTTSPKTGLSPSSHVPPPHIPAHLNAHSMMSLAEASMNPRMTLQLGIPMTTQHHHMTSPLHHVTTPAQQMASQLAAHALKAPFMLPMVPLDLTCGNRQDDTRPSAQTEDESLVESNPEIFLFGRNRHNAARTASRSTIPSDNLQSRDVITNSSDVQQVKDVVRATQSDVTHEDDVTPPASPELDPVGED